MQGTVNMTIKKDLLKRLIITSIHQVNIAHKDLIMQKMRYYCLQWFHTVPIGSIRWRPTHMFSFTTADYVRGKTAQLFWFHQVWKHPKCMGYRPKSPTRVTGYTCSLTLEDQSPKPSSRINLKSENAFTPILISVPQYPKSWD